VAAGTDGDLEHLVVALLCRVEVPDEATIDLKLARVVVGCHVTATVPAFVADAEVRDLIRSRMTIGGALFSQCGWLRRGQVFEPFGRFLRCARTEIE